MKRITEAIKFAADAHSKQLRKLNEHPYVFHVCEVAETVACMTKNEDTIIAALLHDCVEDTDVTIDQVEAKFGKRVAQLVKGESEDKRRNMLPSLTWRQRKEESINELRNANDIELKKIWLADKISNIRSVNRYYMQHGEETWTKFHETNPLSHKWYYTEIAKILEEDLHDYPIYQEYIKIIDNLFGRY